MSRGLATIPHVPIVRVKHDSGETVTLEPGSFVNVCAAEGIYAERGAPVVVVQLPLYDWRFTVADEHQAVEWARKLNVIARR